MSYETIDKIMDNFDTCGKFMITGGEPLLALDEIEYFVQQLNNKRVGVLEITTNGTALDSRIINIYSEFVVKDEQRIAYLRISNDKFHDLEQSKKAYDFYCKATEQYHNIIVMYEQQENDPMAELRFTGRAKNMLTDIDKYLPYVDCINAELKTPHRIKIQDGKISCTLTILPNGDVGFGEELSFDTEDAQVLGNIKNDPLSVIIEKHNDSCLLSCCDSFNIDKLKCRKLLFMPALHSFLEKEMARNFNNSNIQLFCVYTTTFIGEYILDRLYSLRKQAKERFPLLTPEEIITAIPMPYDITEYVISKSHFVVKNSTSVGPEVIKKYSDDFTKQIYQKAVNEAKRIDFNDQSGFGLDDISQNYAIKMCDNLMNFFILTVYPYTIFTEDAMWSWEDIRLTPVFSKLQKLNDAHKSGKIPPKNDSILLCMDNAIENGKRNDRAGECDFLLSVDTFFDYYFGFSPRLNNVIKAIFSRIWDSTKFHATNNNPEALPFDEAI